MGSKKPESKLPTTRFILVSVVFLTHNMLLMRFTKGFSGAGNSRRFLSSSLSCLPPILNANDKKSHGLNLNFNRRLEQNRCRLQHRCSSVLLRSTAESTIHSVTTKAAKEASNIVYTKEVVPQAVSIPKKFVPMPFDYHKQLTIKIDSLTNMGWGVGRVKLEEESTSESYIDSSSDTDDDSEEDKNERLWVVMVPHVLVGETVRVSIFRNMKSYSEADLVDVLEASPERVKPKCALAGTCGGCQYQHMSIKAQREWKTKHVEEVLLQQNIDGYNTPNLLGVLPTSGTKEVYGYRSKITPHYQAPIEHPDGTYEMQAIGFQRSSNRNLIDVPECYIAMPAINEKYKETRVRLHQEAEQGLLNIPPKKKRRRRRGSKGGAQGATLLFRQADDEHDEDSDDANDGGKPLVITDHNQYMTTTIKGLKFRYIAGNFFQNNNYVVPLMVDAVVKAATMPVAATGRAPSKLIDCYCGSGLFAVSAASHFDLCVGIELNDKAIGEATANAESNGITNCQFMAASAEAIFTSPPEITISGFEQQRVQTFDRQETVVIVDPPRKGCSEEFLKQLYEYSPQRIVYMSCGPATQARDAKGIVEIGGYEVTSIEPFDLFPQTKHIESLMVFEKKEPESSH
jgi:23S rRNA (uracil1939-C5)-methyltransferase/tRNA (uracil-5-)-methyltransferase